MKNGLCSSYSCMSTLIAIILLNGALAKFITEHNSTHFICDEDKESDKRQILSYDAFNDDYCDCSDGSDENRTNACENGIYHCKNRFHEPVSISTSKLNDGICDCCDGSDEYNSLSCPKTCLDLSKKEYTKMSEEIAVFKTVISTFDIPKRKKYFQSIYDHIDAISEKIRNHNKINEECDLLIDYALKMEHDMKIHNANEEDEENLMDYKDEATGIVYKDIRDEIKRREDEINKIRSDLDEEKHNLDDLSKYNILTDSSKTCVKFSYNHNECELCLGNNLQCKNSKNYKSKDMGHFSFFENNVLYYFNGASCAFYNRKLYSEVSLECGSYEKVEFVRKIGKCGYKFVFNTKVACNVNFLENMKGRINIFLSEV